VSSVNRRGRHVYARHATDLRQLGQPHSLSGVMLLLVAAAIFLHVGRCPVGVEWVSVCLFFAPRPAPPSAANPRPCASPTAPGPWHGRYALSSRAWAPAARVRACFSRRNRGTALQWPTPLHPRVRAMWTLRDSSVLHDASGAAYVYTE
jgi:hypothetical protein